MKPVLTIILTLLLSTPLCHAQTEIEGSVSGEWTAEDSPYIVIDSTWVPEDSTLTIEAGVTVMFGAGIGLDVFGRLTAEGTEEDSIRFTSIEDSIRWEGFRLQENSFDTQHYSIIERCINGFEMEERSRLWLYNCRTDVELMPIGGASNNIRATRVYIDDSVILGGELIRLAWGTRVEISKSIIKTGGAIEEFHGER